MNNKAGSLLYVRKYEDAIKYYDKALAVDPNYISALQGKREALDREKNNTCDYRLSLQ